MKLKTIITEFAILIALFIATWLFVFWFTPAQNILNPYLTINRQTTFFILGWQIMVMTPFLMLTTLVYFIKEAVHLFKRKFQSIILIAGNFLLIVQLCKIVSFVDFLSIGGGTAYPSLSELPGAHQLFQNIAAIWYLGYVLFAVLIIFLLMLVISVFFTGKNWKPKSHEPAV